jgi:hypothetical protein
MYEIQLTDQVYSQVKRRAVEAGYEDVDDYVVSVLTYDPFENSKDLDHLFTPERLAHIDRAAAQIKTGESHSASEVREHFKKRFEA